MPPTWIDDRRIPAQAGLSPTCRRGDAPGRGLGSVVSRTWVLPSADLEIVTASSSSTWCCDTSRYVAVRNSWARNASPKEIPTIVSAAGAVAGSFTRPSSHRLRRSRGGGHIVGPCLLRPTSTSPSCCRSGPTRRRTASSPPKASSGRDPAGLVPQGRARRDHAADAGGDARHRPLPAPGPLRQLRTILDDPEASENDRFVALDLLKNAAIAAGGMLPMCQDTGTAIVKGKKGQLVVTGGGDEGDRRRRAADVPHEQPALQPDGADHDVRGEEHRHEPAGRDQALGDRRRRVQVPVHRQGGGRS